MVVAKRHYPRRVLTRVGNVRLNYTPATIQFLRDRPQLLGLQNTTVDIKDYTYILTDFLGQGGQGAVYAARVKGTDNYYAIKLQIWEQSALPTERLKHRSAQSFKKELENMMRLQEQSEHVVKFIDAHVESTEVFVLGWLVMELGDGDVSTLIQKMAVKKAKSNANADIAGASFTHGRDRKHVWRQLVKCVEVLSGENIVNTDLKPGNFITFKKKIKLGDLGLAVPTNSGLLYRGGGTPAYSAPEVLTPKNFTPRAQRVSSKADVWSLGVILYEMTYGTHPPEPNRHTVRPGTYESGNQHNSDPPPGKRVTKDPYLRDILYRTLQFNPANRLDIKQLRKHPYTQGSRKGFF